MQNRFRKKTSLFLFSRLPVPAGTVLKWAAGETTSAFFQIFCGGDAEIPFEHPGKTEHIGISRGDSGLAGGLAVLPHKLGTLFQAEAGQVLLRRFSGLPPEEAAEIAAVKIETPRQL